MIPPPPKAYWRLIHVIQTSRAASAAVTTESRTPRAVMWNTEKESMAKTTARAVMPPII
jgi:post-segregation antitoxin (ccd killing protein)